MADLVLEIGCEEMPARFLPPATAQLAAQARAMLARQGLLEESEAEKAVRVVGTPRRLGLLVSGLKKRQEDREEEVLGPPEKNAYDAEGKPTKAALGFAKSQGITADDLVVMDTDKGPRVGYRRAIAGRPAPEVLTELLPALIESLSFPKTMRWGSGKFRYARPIHWILALLDGKVVPFELAGIKSGDSTRGHRFLSPGKIKVKGPGDYLEKLEKAEVVARREIRLEMTRKEVEAAAKKAGGRLVPDEELLTEVHDLVELPVACAGSFDAEFLEVPRPVIISAMREHQRYFALEDSKGNLLPAFVAVNNTRPRDLKVVTAGHEKVLRARLADARFFLQEDRRRPLIDRLEDLEAVTYHAKLGTSRQKVERQTALAVFLAEEVKPKLVQKVRRASLLAKCDLVTEMVGEFPSLQGVVGSHYALADGEDPDVAAAVADHYLPAGADSRMPGGLVGVLVGLGDRIDTICGCFGVGLVPTGAADPYGLRRAAIAVIRLVTENRLKLSLSRVLDKSLTGLAQWLERPAQEVADEVSRFLATRFQGLLADQGVPTDVAQAVLAAGLDDLTAVRDRALALADVKDTPDFLPLAVGMKRVMNILKKEAAQVPETPPSPHLIKEEAEKVLFDAFLELEEEAGSLLAEHDYTGFLVRISDLKGPIDAFFDDVLVMDPDEAVRRNRLALLSRIAALFGQLAEFTYLQLG